MGASGRTRHFDESGGAGLPPPAMPERTRRPGHSPTPVREEADGSDTLPLHEADHGSAALERSNRELAAALAGFQHCLDEPTAAPEFDVPAGGALPAGEPGRGPEVGVGHRPYNRREGA